MIGVAAVLSCGYAGALVRAQDQMGRSASLSLLTVHGLSYSSMVMLDSAPRKMPFPH